MKVQAAKQRIILEVAEIDAELAKLRHRRRNLPEDIKISGLQEKIYTARDEVVNAGIVVEDLNRKYRRIDGEISGMRNREQHDLQLLNQAGMGPRALSELQHELAGLSRRRRLAEDELLELMEQQEATIADKSRAQAAVDALLDDLERATTARDTAAAELDASISKLSKRRAEIVVDASVEMLAIYDRQMANGKLGAGLLRQKRCGACRMELDCGTLSTIAAADQDDVLRCEECGALLIRNQESGL